MYEKNPMTSRERINEELLRRTQCNDGALAIEVSNKPCMEHEMPSLGTLPLASVYSPVQIFRELYDLEQGFVKGTIFKELDFPFLCGEKGGSCCGK